ncbi:hypothetical protein FZC35_00430 [Candidatus Cytomitobacter indipagum]|uniref:tRNA (guanine(46)-N(7))-methyltransferase n=1 Tax=Candidatus Cytomitobacter indipagum TaxID=2601575 RepID=A0A5C0UFM8_9PROT|nr:hypothetical protein [Candidatus Cytomitobacter indipagum]QEK37854.1 hypothetical protein FZC35_00430 [Candidatus Cytomitobacter indipagum]
MTWTCGRSRKLKNNLAKNCEKNICNNENIRDVINNIPKEKKLCLDIGFGSGASVMQTLKDENTVVVGCEIFKPAILQTLMSVNDNSKVFLFMSFIDDLIKKIPSCSFDEIKMLCPDPWPKYKHRMRRCYNIYNFDLKIARILKGKGKFIMASDISEMTLNMVKLFDSPIFNIECNKYTDYDSCPHKTDYCRKGFRAGRDVNEMISIKAI